MKPLGPRAARPLYATVEMAIGIPAPRAPGLYAIYEPYEQRAGRPQSQAGSCERRQHLWT